MRKKFLMNKNDFTFMKRLNLILLLCCLSEAWPGLAAVTESLNRCMCYGWKNFQTSISHRKYRRYFFSSAKFSSCFRKWSSYIFLFLRFDIFYRRQSVWCLWFTFHSRVSDLKDWSNQLFVSDKRNAEIKSGRKKKREEKKKT